MFIVLNEALRSPSRVLDYFTSAEAQQSVPPGPTLPYRPLRTLHYALLTWPTGSPHPLPFHFANLAWHTAAAVLFYFLMRRLAAAPALAFLAALGFAVHPVASEVVAWIKSLDDIMAVCFVLGAFLAAFAARPFASVALYALALLSKESVTLLFPLFLFPIAASPLRRAAKWAWFGGFICSGVAYLLLRDGVIGQTSQAPYFLSGTYGRTLVDMLAVVLIYARTLLGLPPFLPDYSFLRGPFPPAQVLAGGALLFAVAAAAAWGMIKRNLMTAFGALWILLSLLLVSNIVPMASYFAERFVYLPLAGFLILAVSFLGTSERRLKAAVPVSLVVIAAWAGLAWAAAGKWSDGRTLMTYAYRHSPPASRIILNYLIELEKTGDYDAIEKILDKESDRLLAAGRTVWLRAEVLIRKGQVEEGHKRLKGLEPVYRHNPYYLLRVGEVYAQEGDWEKARVYLDQVRAKWPSLDRSRWNKLESQILEGSKKAT